MSRYLLGIVLSHPHLEGYTADWNPETNVLHADDQYSDRFIALMMFTTYVVFDICPAIFVLLPSILDAMITEKGIN